MMLFSDEGHQIAVCPAWSRQRCQGTGGMSMKTEAAALSGFLPRRPAARRLQRDQRGVSAMEYGLIAGIIALVISVSFNAMSVRLNIQFSNINTAISSYATQ